MCGEKLAPPFWNASIGGSPPHVRGKAATGSAPAACDGITPACAGKRCSQAKAPMKRQDHPRMCGEKRFPVSLLHCLWGSPPHVRGKVSSCSYGIADCRITPACAGKSRPITRAINWQRDHPRMCGEKRFNRDQTILTTGSPPHVRGKVGLCRCSRFRDRITPACAGKSRPITRAINWQRDHPRMCGEKRFLLFRLLFLLGSPPHVRGKEWKKRRGCRQKRITPACAGKSY